MSTCVLENAQDTTNVPSDPHMSESLNLALLCISIYKISRRKRSVNEQVIFSCRVPLGFKVVFLCTKVHDFEANVFHISYAIAI